MCISIGMCISISISNGMGISSGVCISTSIGINTGIGITIGNGISLSLSLYMSSGTGSHSVFPRGTERVYPYTVPSGEGQSLYGVVPFLKYCVLPYIHRYYHKESRL